MLMRQSKHLELELHAFYLLSLLQMNLRDRQIK